MQMKYKRCGLFRRTTEILKTGLQLTRIAHFVAMGKRAKLTCTFHASGQAFQ